MTALKNSEALLNGCDFSQLCYDGQVVNKSDRYVFSGQFLQAHCKKESVTAVKSFPSGTSVTSEVLFNTITTEACEKLLAKVYSVMADTTAINTGKKSGVNKRLQVYIMENVGHDIYTLECLFHVNEIYFTHVVSLVEGRKKGPGAMQEGALFNKIKSIPKTEPTTEIVRENLSKVSITGIALLHLKSKVEWFAEQKRGGLEQKDNFRTDQMCMLVLTCSICMDVPAALKSLLLYKQETLCHSRWITTASGYLRLYLFNSDKLSDKKIKLTKLISYTVSVYVPCFIMIHLKPKACDGPFLTLFQ